jgi:hypothetical protein
MKKAILFILVLGHAGVLLAQGMQRTVDLKYVNQPLEAVLADLEEQYALRFSYSPDLIPLDKKVSVAYRQAPLSAAIEDICQQVPMQYKAFGSQIMLKPMPRQTEELSQLETRKGKVEQKSPIYPPSKEALESRRRLTQVITPIHSRPATVINRPGGDDYKTLSFSPRMPPEMPTDESENELARGDKRLAQISLLPYVGTNLDRSDEITNNVSVNLLWGTNGGVDGLEVGLLYNKVTNNVNGLQVAGLGSSVAGDVNGTQVAGVFNSNGGKVQGVQAAGLFNISEKGGNAVQAAGLFNISKGDFAGLQASGLFNVSKGKVDGMQISPLFNHSEDRTRSQISGLFNQAGDVEGGQISPLLNIADNVEGFQIGLINIADTVSGVPIGLLNIVRNGYNRFELSANDAMYANASLKLGAYSFYNIFQAGLRWDDYSITNNTTVQGAGMSDQSTETRYTWGLGYGIGTTLPLSKRMLLNVEAVSLQINELGQWTTTLNLLNQARLTFDYHGIDRRTSVFVGPVFHFMWSKVKDAETGEVGSQVIKPSYTLFEDNNGVRSLQGWIGIQGGLRF